MLAVRQMMQKSTQSVLIGHPLSEARERMEEYDQDALPVLDGDEIVGLISRSEVMGAQEKPVIPERREKVIDHITGEVAYCLESDSATTALTTMLATGHQALVVTGDDRQLSGIITYEMIRQATEQAAGRDESASQSAAERRIETHAHASGDSEGHPRQYTVEPHLPNEPDEPDAAHAENETGMQDEDEDEQA